MVSLIQCDVARAFMEEGWASVGIPRDLDRNLFGGPITLVNAVGDLMKVYASGEAVLIRADEWRGKGTAVSRPAQSRPRPRSTGLRIIDLERFVEPHAPGGDEVSVG